VSAMMMIEIKELEDFITIVRAGKMQVFLQHEPTQDMAFILPQAPYPIVYGHPLPTGKWKELEVARPDDGLHAIEADIRPA
jgi:hypothetical protein